ncbi:MAG: hypothetical protein QOJ03_1680 [Frankiaceae bacterium]|nr:hypothetical protein [Frankiaceae bacterium]
MPAPRYRLAGHAVAAVLLAGVAVVATGAGAGAANSAASARPDSYGGDSAAASIEFRVDKQPFPFPVTDPFHTWVPYAGTSIDSSGGAEAIASSVYPGQGVLGVRALICVFAAQLCDAIPGGVPDYPDWAHAQYPAHPDDSAALSQKPFPGTGPFEVTPNSVEAHADSGRVEATTITSGGGVTGVVTVQSASSHSLQRFVGSTLVLTAESVLKGVDIGGQLHIDEIRSTATGTIDGSHPAAASAITTISGATVAGQGVTIDSSGIHAAGASDKGQVKQAINAALKSLAGQGISVMSLGNSKAAHVRKIAAETGGLLVVAKQTVNGPGLPKVGGIENGDYTITATVGGAGVNAFADPAVPFGGGIPLPSTHQPGAGHAPSASTGGTVPPPPSTPETGTAPAGQQPAVVAGSATPKQVALPIDLTNKRLETLALVLLGYPLLVLMAAPFRAPSRLPRAR